MGARWMVESPSSGSFRNPKDSNLDYLSRPHLLRPDLKWEGLAVAVRFHRRFRRRAEKCDRARLKGLKSGKPFDLSVPLIEARDCMFQPWVTIVRNGHAVEVVNMDPVMHDIQGL